MRDRVAFPRSDSKRQRRALNSGGMFPESTLLTTRGCPHLYGNYSPGVRRQPMSAHADFPSSSRSSFPSMGQGRQWKVGGVLCWAWPHPSGNRTWAIPFCKDSHGVWPPDRAPPHPVARCLMSHASSTSQDFVTALSILLRGTVHEKLRWTFNLYDINKDGYINKEVSELRLGARES